MKKERQIEILIERADDLATELIGNGHEEISAVDILDGLASLGYILAVDGDLSTSAYYEELVKHGK